MTWPVAAVPPAHAGPQASRKPSPTAPSQLRQAALDGWLNCRGILGSWRLAGASHDNATDSLRAKSPPHPSRYRKHNSSTEHQTRTNLVSLDVTTLPHCESLAITQEAVFGSRDVVASPSAVRADPPPWGCVKGLGERAARPCPALIDSRPLPLHRRPPWCRPADAWPPLDWRWCWRVLLLVVLALVVACRAALLAVPGRAGPWCP